MRRATRIRNRAKRQLGWLLRCYTEASLPASFPLQASLLIHFETYYNAPAQTKAEEMARKKMFQNVEFLSITLPAESKPEFLDWQDEHATHLLESLDALVANGLKFSATFAPGEGTYIVSVTNRNEKSENHMRCFSSRAGTLVDALFLMVYKTTVLLADADWSDHQRDTNWG